MALAELTLDRFFALTQPVHGLVEVAMVDAAGDTELDQEAGVAKGW